MDENYSEETEEEAEYKEITFVLDPQAFERLKKIGRKVGFDTPEIFLSCTTGVYNSLYEECLKRKAKPGLLKKDGFFYEIIIPGINTPYLSNEISLSEEDLEKKVSDDNWKRINLLLENQIIINLENIADKTGAEDFGKLIGHSFLAYYNFYQGHMRHDLMPGLIDKNGIFYLLKIPGINEYDENIE
jgi:hypothetical protein